MPPRHQEQQQPNHMLLEASARQLHVLLQSPAALQLLQHPPPGAAPTRCSTPEQHGLIGHSDLLLAEIVEQCEQQDTAAPGRMLGLLLRQQAARSVGTLVAWLQQRPEQLQFSVLQQRIDSGRVVAERPTTANLFVVACECLKKMTGALVDAAESPQPGCSTAALAAAMLQQLEQSGAHLCTFNKYLIKLRDFCLITCLYCCAICSALCSCTLLSDEPITHTAPFRVGHRLSG
jgi:hypothetical protein